MVHERLCQEYGFSGNYQRVKLYVQEARPCVAEELSITPLPIRYTGWQSMTGDSMNGRIRRVLVIAGAAIVTTGGIGVGVASAAPGDQVAAGDTIAVSTSRAVGLVPVDYSCAGGTGPNSLYVTIRQGPTKPNPNTPSEHEVVALASGTGGAVCDGGKHHTEVFVRFETGGIVPGQAKNTTRPVDSPASVSVALNGPEVLPEARYDGSANIVTGDAAADEAEKNDPNIKYLVDACKKLPVEKREKKAPCRALAEKGLI